MENVFPEDLDIEEDELDQLEDELTEDRPGDRRSEKRRNWKGCRKQWYRGVDSVVHENIENPALLMSDLQ